MSSSSSSVSLPTYTSLSRSDFSSWPFISGQMPTDFLGTSLFGHDFISSWEAPCSLATGLTGGGDSFTVWTIADQGNGFFVIFTEDGLLVLPVGRQGNSSSVALYVVRGSCRTRSSGRIYFSPRCVPLA